MILELALYRKYRSSDFSQVIGQEHVVKTLQTAVANQRTSHAYLFTGPRGVGKTSVARLLARAINCTGEPKPCNRCPNCQAQIGSHLDLIEIDAASNRSIDEVRELRDKIGLAPAQGKYKIYIIDEVHMLTKEAFNALLKTLEEPPPHAIFILATTEAHRLPETIISRTQRFNFKPISPADITTQLDHIAKSEGIKITPAATSLLALASRGSLRDAISLIDQLASLGKTQIDAPDVRWLLGWSDPESLAAISLALARANSTEVLVALDRLTSTGAQSGQIIRQLTDWWREVMLIAAGAGHGDETQKQLAGQLSLGRIINIVDSLSAASAATWPEVALEATLVKLSLAASEKSTKTPVTTVAPAPAQKVGSQAASLPEAWPKALILIKQSNNSLYALLRSCQIQPSGDSLTIVCRFNFHRDRLMESKNRQIIDEALAKAYGRPIQARAVVEASPTQTAPELDANTELVSSALEILGGEIVDE